MQILLSGPCFQIDAIKINNTTMDNAFDKEIK